ncbi:hypothetical protein KW797_00160 [Candidatus Parcubacteria bacterium]|nr:hypothetical protein [Candidatus Parcubacteria bacterium]
MTRSHSLHGTQVLSEELAKLLWDAQVNEPNFELVSADLSGQPSCWQHLLNRTWRLADADAPGDNEVLVLFTQSLVRVAADVVPSKRLQEVMLTCKRPSGLRLLLNALKKQED